MRMKMENFTESPLSHDDLAYIVNACVSSFDTQLSLITNVKEYNTIVTNIISWHSDIDISVFFVLSNLERVSVEVCENVSLRSFLLNMNDRINFTIMSMVDKYNNDFIDQFVKSIVSSRSKDYSKSLLNSELNETLAINGDVLKSLLKENVWLLNLYIILMYFHETNLYKSLLTENKTTNP